MANHKRRKSRRRLRCTMCTDARGGNSNKMTGKQPRIILNTQSHKTSFKEAMEDLFRPDED